MTLVGTVTGKHAVLVDDIADTCGTLIKAAEKWVGVFPRGRASTFPC
jgi:ribose-phosphate pyrophosphokinase